MSKNKSYAICIELGSVKMPILTLAFSADGSFSIQDRLEIEKNTSIYRIFQIPFPVDKVGMGKGVLFEGHEYYSTNKPKLSHHAKSGVFQISSANGKWGTKIISGFENGQPKGIANYSFQLQNATNDGGPIITGMFWGLNNLQAGTIRSSEALIFSESCVRDQTMNNRGSKAAFAINVFHSLKRENAFKYIDQKWARYLYRHYKRPLLTRVIDPGPEHNYLLGISCLLMRCNEKSSHGYRIGGGPGIVDQSNGRCLNTFVMLDMPHPGIPSDAINLDYTPDE